MAAGEGKRMRPLTARWPKPILPIEGRPVVTTLLHELAAAGLRRVTVVVGYLGEQIEALVGDGRAFGVAVRYARQPEPVGSADAVARALLAGAGPPLLVSAADTVYRAGDVDRAARAWLASGAAGGLAVRHLPGEPLARSVRVADGLVLEVVEDPAPEAPRSPFFPAPLWFLDAELAAGLAHLPGPPFELADAFQRAIDTGSRVAALEIGPTRDLTAPEDVLTRNFPYLWARNERDL